MADAFSNLNDVPKSATESIDARQWLVPGWYWSFLDPGWEDSAGWSAFSKQNPTVKTTKTVGTTTKGSWVLFQVLGPQPVIWTLPGFPSKAIKGAATEYSDIVDQSQIDPSVESSLSDFLGNIGAQLGTAGKVILWGGVAIVLWQLFQKTGGSASSARVSRSAPADREEYEEERVVTRRSSPRHSEPSRTRSGTLVSRYR
mgnify:CR=1 FL=1